MKTQNNMLIWKIYNGLLLPVLMLVLITFPMHNTGFVSFSLSTISNNRGEINEGATTIFQSRIPLVCDEESYSGTSVVTTTITDVIINKNEETENSNNKNDSDKYNSSNNSSPADDFDTILRTRRTINSFLPNLPDDWELILTNAIQSAVHAPNHKRTEPWRFHLLGPKTIRQVCELNASIVAEKKGAKAGKQKLDRWLLMPGWLVVTCKTTDNNNTSNDTVNVNLNDPSGIAREDYAACCCAVQNLCLSFHNAGMGTKWTTGPVNFDSRYNDVIGFKEEDEYVVGTIWFGTPDTKSNAPVKKKSIEDVLVRRS